MRPRYGRQNVLPATVLNEAQNHIQENVAADESLHLN